MPMYWTFNFFLGCIYTVYHIVYLYSIFLVLKRSSTVSRIHEWVQKDQIFLIVCFNVFNFLLASLVFVIFSLSPWLSYCELWRCNENFLACSSFRFSFFFSTTQSFDAEFSWGFFTRFWRRLLYFVCWSKALDSYSPLDTTKFNVD